MIEDQSTKKIPVKEKDKKEKTEMIEDQLTKKIPEKENKEEKIEDKLEAKQEEHKPKEKENPESDEKFGEIKANPNKKEDCLHIINLFENLLDNIEETDPIKVMSSPENLKSFEVKYLPSAERKNSSLFDISTLINQEKELTAINQTNDRLVNLTLKKNTNELIQANNSTVYLPKTQPEYYLKNNRANSTSTEADCRIDKVNYNKELNLHKMLLETKHMKSVLVTLYLKRKLDKLQEMKKKQMEKEKARGLPPVFNSKEIVK